MEKFWESALGITGLAGLGVFTFVSLFGRWLKLDIFPRLDRKQASKLMWGFLTFVLIFSLACLGIYAYLETHTVSRGLGTEGGFSKAGEGPPEDPVPNRMASATPKDKHGDYKYGPLILQNETGRPIRMRFWPYHPAGEEKLMRWKLIPVFESKHELSRWQGGTNYIEVEDFNTKRLYKIGWYDLGDLTEAKTPKVMTITKEFLERDNPDGFIGHVEGVSLN